MSVEGSLVSDPTAEHLDCMSTSILALTPCTLLRVCGSGSVVKDTLYFLLKPLQQCPSRKSADFTPFNAVFLFEKVNLKPVPFGKDVSHHQVHQPLLSVKYKNTHISDFLTINTESCIPQEKAPKLVT